MFISSSDSVNGNDIFMMIYLREVRVSLNEIFMRGIHNGFQYTRNVEYSAVVLNNVQSMHSVIIVANAFHLLSTPKFNMTST